MKYTDLPNEQTTAATDLLLGLLALCCAVRLLLLWGASPHKVSIWVGALALLAASGILGAVVHAFVWADEDKALLWRFLYPCLALTVALFALGACLDLYGRLIAVRAAPVVLLLAVAFAAYKIAVPAGFLAFVLYSAVAMVFALSAYTYLAVTRKQPGAAWIAAGVLAAIAGAVIQATKIVQFRLVWDFDHNSAFHLAQMLSTALLTAGVSASVRAVPK